ncbi:MAG: hypothetical protein KDA95_04755 [Acidimicrobiales bacterium]|nr:hypothetical protein [Acidimicrobiales bacterium]
MSWVVTEDQANEALRQTSVPPLADDAWKLRHNISMAQLEMALEEGPPLFEALRSADCKPEGRMNEATGDLVQLYEVGALSPRNTWVS